MRLTNFLFQVNYHRHFQRIWKRQGKMEIQDLGVPPTLQAMGVEVKDAKEIFLKTRLCKLPDIENIKGPISTPSVFNYKKCIYVMHKKTKVSENENQTLALTKTVPYKDLPNMLTSLVGLDELPNQDELVKNSILQAQVWDAAQDKLPKKIDIERPGYVFKRQYGIRHKKKVSGLLEKLSLLCDSASGKYAGCFQMSKAIDTFSEITVNRCYDTVIFQMPCDILLTSEKPLKPFSSKDQVEETRSQSVPNIYPVKPVLDLEKYENLLDQQKSGTNLLDHQSSSAYLHTLFIVQKSFGFWFPQQMLARAIATCFAFTASEAQRKYGTDVKELPEPINVQCIYMDIKSFNFLAYQLNTLNLENDDGIKNQVWIDEASNLYQEVSEADQITDYNPSIFPKMLAFHINGLHPSSM